MNEDRQYFETKKLKNGITVYSHSMDVPFFDISVIVPFGSSNSIPENPGGVNGIAHFLEHIVLNRSELNPEKDSFSRELSLKGGHVNASTNSRSTRLYCSAPVAIQDEAVKGLFSSVWKPILTNEEDLKIERTIVENERNRRKYFPGSNEIGKYVFTEWMSDESLSKSQVFGTDTDLNAMVPEKLTQFHELYFTDQCIVLVGGGHSLDSIIEELEKVETKAITAQDKINPPGWAKMEYHSHEFKDIDYPTYYVGSIVNEFNYEDSYAVNFILRLLTNTVHGPLYKWTREEKGWTYGISYSHWTEPDRMSWKINLPLNTVESAEEFRKEMHPRIIKALVDKVLIKKEVDRIAYNDLYSYQTLDDRLDIAAYSLRQNGRILSEQEYKNLNAKMNNSELLLSIYKKYLSPEVTGELLALPYSAENKN
jgi:predicted Zn-dependent peptidase